MPQITVKATIENLPAVTAFVDELLEENDCGMRAQMQLNIAIDELFSNIAHYAYPGGEGEVTIDASFDEPRRMVALTFTDTGIPYNPLKRKDPDITLSAEERQIGGLGIMMVRKTMDGMTYEYSNGHNILTISKKI